MTRVDKDTKWEGGFWGGWRPEMFKGISEFKDGELPPPPVVEVREGGKVVRKEKRMVYVPFQKGWDDPENGGFGVNVVYSCMVVPLPPTNSAPLCPSHPPNEQPSRSSGRSTPQSGVDP